MRKIYKYELERTDAQYIHLPIGYKMLAVKIQNDRIFLWALVDNNNPIYHAYIRIFGTGNPIEDESNLEFIDTVEDSSFIWHIFEEK